MCHQVRFDIHIHGNDFAKWCGKRANEQKGSGMIPVKSVLTRTVPPSRPHELWVKV